MDVNGALDYGYNHLPEVEGWFSPLDFAVITAVLVAQEQHEVHGDLAEIGVWRGKSAILLSFFARESEEIYAIDVFDLYYPDGPPATAGRPYADPALFQQNLLAYGRPGAVRTLTSDTRGDHSLVSQISGHGIRFFHIDGGHSYEHVAADLSTALDSIGANTVVVLDDFLQVENPAVSEAIFAILRKSATDLTPFAITPKKLYLTNRSHARTYWRYLTALIPNAITRKRSLLGSTPLILNPTRFRLDRDYNSELIRCAGQPMFDDLITAQSARFPRVEEWIDASGSLNAEMLTQKE